MVSCPATKRVSSWSRICCGEAGRRPRRGRPPASRRIAGILAALLVLANHLVQNSVDRGDGPSQCVAFPHPREVEGQLRERDRTKLLTVSTTVVTASAARGLRRPVPC